MELRSEAIKADVADNHGSRHYKAFRGGVQKRGRLDEATLPILSAGVRPGAIPELLSYTPGAIRLLRTRKLWFVPVVNPDRYEWNRRTHPTGGGMERKNRRPSSCPRTNDP